ncbi:MerR family transcriptional regulator [Bacillus alkalicellulosilyticus]|uniref:MerR family transcriptional regulator n=1 Tax=Alkalihalobacterium alkalicellulosilyticum TaxID=1912214 RepID=UPI001481E9AC|nr:MerR family transcriptional regulator [Bacillus alkalicellulosilyticus]
MGQNDTYSIGEFSQKTGVSIRTLHYYNDIGLLNPEKNPSSGHRMYRYDDIVTFHKILSLKQLGYSLEKISNLLDETSFTVELNESLALQLQSLEKEKAKIEQLVKNIRRVQNLLEQEGEVDSRLLFSLIHAMEGEREQKQWMKQNNFSEVLEELSQKSEEEQFSLDQSFVQLANEVKQLYGTPINHPSVQDMVSRYMQSIFTYLGDDLMEKLADVNIEEIDVKDLENMVNTPFTKEEQTWLNEAMEHHMKQSEIEK